LEVGAELGNRSLPFDHHLTDDQLVFCLLFKKINVFFVLNLYYIYI
jgi:hypothetical protein